MTIRTLPQAAQAARNQNLEIIPTLLPEVLLECPACKQSGTKNYACIEITNNAPVVRCAGCERWDDDPHDILRILGHDPDTTDEFEIALRVFDLLWALERAT